MKTIKAREINLLKSKLEKQIRSCSGVHESGRFGCWNCDTIGCSEGCKAGLKLNRIATHFYRKHLADLQWTSLEPTPFTCDFCNTFFNKEVTAYALYDDAMTYELPETYCGDCVKKIRADRDQNEKNMKNKPKKLSKKAKKFIQEFMLKRIPRMKKTKTNKNEIIVVPTTQKTDKKVKATTKFLKPRTPASKSSTCAYYDCLIDLVSSPENDRVRITDLTHKCKCSKEKLAQQKAQIKHQLIHELARDYKSIGENLGKYVKTDIVGCAKELEK